jgi:chromodomain-helicase-DNA-binding protein 7
MLPVLCFSCESFLECTWERAEDFNDDQKIAEFRRVNRMPDEATLARQSLSLPKLKWAKLTQSPNFKGGNTLRPYQLEGMSWLTFCWYERRGSILADEMGLGKTVQSISLLWHLFNVENIRGPFLIVAPLSTIGHWVRELEEWTDMNVVVYQGNKQNRELTRKFEFHYLDQRGEPINKKYYKFHCLLTTYEMIMSRYTYKNKRVFLVCSSLFFFLSFFSSFCPLCVF